MSSNWQLCAAVCRLAVPAAEAPRQHEDTVPYIPCEQSDSRQDICPREQNPKQGIRACWALQGHAGN